MEKKRIARLRSPARFGGHYNMYKEKKKIVGTAPCALLKPRAVAPKRRVVNWRRSTSAFTQK